MEGEIMRNFRLFLVWCLLLFAGISCSDQGTESGTNDTGSFLDTSIDQFTNLGFLGAEGYGLPKPIVVKDTTHPEKSHYPGGVVISDFQKGSLLEKAGLKAGDVIVKVADDFLPNKENPSWDLLKRMEASLSAGKTNIVLGVWRKNKVLDLTVDIDTSELPPIIPGGTQACERYRSAARKGLAFLAGLQKEDGSFPVNRVTPDSELAVTSLAGLAFLASASIDESNPYEDNVKKCVDFIKSRFEGTISSDPIKMNDVFIAGDDVKIEELDLSQMENMDVLQISGNKVVGERENGDRVISKQMIGDANGTGKGIAVNDTGTPGDTGAEGEGAYRGDAKKADPSRDSGHLGAAFAFLFLSEYMDTVQDFGIMQVLVSVLPVVMEAQQENGQWLLCEREMNEALGHSEKSLATSLCLSVLGCAERSGVFMSDNSSFEKACAYLKATTNNGDVGYIPDPAFDRRSEVGRLAGVLAAMRSISCPFSDGYMKKLFDYYSDLSKEVPLAEMDEAIHLLSSAMLSKQKGLPQWSRFNEEHRILLLSLQRNDGSFAQLPKPERREIPFYSDCEGEAWRAAVYTLIFLLQEDALPKFAALQKSENEGMRDSDGKRTEGSSAMPGLPEGLGDLPPGAQTFTFSSEEEAMEFLKSMGLDETSTQIKTIRMGGDSDE